MTKNTCSATISKRSVFTKTLEYIIKSTTKSCSNIIMTCCCPAKKHAAGSISDLFPNDCCALYEWYVDYRKYISFNYLVLPLCIILIEIAEHSEYCTTESKACYGNAGNSLVIPCGPADDFLSNYTYTNDSSKQVIVADSEEFLTVNLTVYDNKNTVICTPSTDGFVAPSYSYELTVYCESILIHFQSFV